MNIVQLQDQLKNFSQDQLMREMQAPSGNAPQFLVLGEIMRRQKMQQDFMAQQAKGDQSTVAQDAVAAAGVPQGGIADMARALAPRSDVAQNTGVKAMAAGGTVKKMKAGDFASIDPAVRAMANKMGMSVSEYLDSVGEEEAARIEQGAQARATRDRMKALEPVGEGLSMPTQADLDRRYLDEKYGLPAARPLATPPAMDMPIVPAIQANIIGQPPSGLPAISPLPAPPAMPPAADVPPQFPSEAPSVLTQSAAALPGLSDTQLEELGTPTEEDLAASAEQAKLDRTKYLMSQLQAERAAKTRPVSNRQAAYEAARAASAAPPETPSPAFEQGGRGQFPATLEEAVAAQEAAAQSPAQQAAVAAAAPSGGVSGGIGGGGGGGGGGAATPYEQALMDALANREKAAQQDKWLALAQVGLNLMASRQPTLAGALGEAGLKGVEAMRAARDTYDKEKLDLLGALEKARASRAVSRGGGAGKATTAPSGGGLAEISAGQGRVFSQINADIERLDKMLSDPMLVGAELSPEQEMQLASAREQRDALLAYRQRLLYGAPLSAGADDTSFSVRE